MPLREYQCEKCGTVKEYREPQASPMMRVCEERDCGGLAKRIMSAPSPPSKSTQGTYTLVGIGIIAYSGEEQKKTVLN